MLKIIADDKIPFLKGILEPYAQIEYLPGTHITLKDLKSADALIVRTRTQCNAGLLEGTKVRFIASATIGHDHIDKDYCIQNNISWVNAPGCNAESVVQYMTSALAMILRQTGKSFKEITIGIVGAGNVGHRLAKLSATLGISTLINDPPREMREGSTGFTSLEIILKNADIISFHVPLTRFGPYKTLHMANADLLSEIRPGAWLINTSRGEVVQTDALKNALQNGVLAGAILDVWEDEPSIDLKLLQMAFIATPHIAGYSADGKANGTAMSVQAISRFFNLGIDRWRPDFIPASPGGIITPSHYNSLEELFCDISLTAYDIQDDHCQLLAHPDLFEKLRENYPIRREAPALTVDGSMLTEEAKGLVATLGYKILG